MTKPQPTDIVHIIVHEGPNKVWVACNGAIHSARWRTSDAGELRAVLGNRGILIAAMTSWSGHETTVTTFEQLEKCSGGWGAWSEEKTCSSDSTSSDSATAKSSRPAE